MIRKLVYLMQVPLTAREFVTFGLEYFLSSGYKVEVWECTAFLNPQLISANGQTNSLANSSARGLANSLASAKPTQLGTGENVALVRQISSAQEAIQAISQLAAPNIASAMGMPDALGASDTLGAPGAVGTAGISEVAFINLLPKNHKALPVFAALNNSAAQSVEVRTNAIPLGAGRLIKKIKKINPVRLFDFVLRRPSFWQHRAGRPGRIIYGGSICRPGVDEVAAGGHLVSAHALDYDDFINYCSQQKLPPDAVQDLACILPAPQKQIVFLDQNLPFHSDFKVLKRQPPVTPEVYFPALRHFFDQLEQTLEMPVVIAAHPRANYNASNDYFGGRKLISGQTLPLVCKSSLVLTHHSTAVNIAVMARRPVLLLTSNQLERMEGATINLIAKNLGTRPVNINKLHSGWDGKLLKFDQAAYTAYFNKYIKEPGSPNLPFWQILEQAWQ